MSRLPLRKPAIVAAMLMGVTAGVGLFTFNYAEGLR